MFKKLEIPSDQPKENRLKKGLSIFGKALEWGIFALVIFAALVIASPLLPTKNIISSYIVTSGSMEPSVHVGSVALVKPVGVETLYNGDIITFASPADPSKTILHRIYEVKKEGTSIQLTTKGDHNDAADNWTVFASAVKGKMIFSIPYLGHTASMMKSPIGFALLLGLPVLFLFIMQIKQIQQGIEEEIVRRTRKAIGVSIFVLSFLVGFSLTSGGTRLVAALFNSQTSVLGIFISTRDYVPPPVPAPVAPVLDSFRNTAGLVMDWTDVSDYENMNNPVYYIYQSARNSSFSPLAYQSGHLSASQISAPGTPDGQYWWRVKACDQLDNCSAWSSVWHVTVDSAAPSKPNWLVPANNSYTNQSQNILFDWSDSSDANLAGYEYENTGPTGVTWKSIDSCGLLIASQIPNSQIGPGGTCINAPAGTLSLDGAYTRRVRAVDKVGNLSSWSDTWTVTRDTVLPFSSFTSPVPNTDVIGDPVTIEGNSSDNYGVASTELLYTDYADGVCGTSYTSIGIMGNSALNSPFAWPTTLWYPPSEGSFCLKARATDLAGNREASPIVANIYYSPTASASLSLSADKKTALFTLDHLSYYTKLTYTLTYDTDQESQGDVGTISLNGENSLSRDITLGTCSTDSCTYYSGVKNFKLKVDLTGKDGNLKSLEATL